MALKFKYARKEEIPAEHAAFYVERDGAFYADIEGVTEKGKADELRNHNIELRKQIETDKARFEGIDPEEVKQLKAEKQRLEEERQIKAGEAEKVFDGRAKAMKTEFYKQLAAKASECEALTARLTAIQIDQGVMTTATKRGLRPRPDAPGPGAGRQSLKRIAAERQIANKRLECAYSCAQNLRSRSASHS